MKRLSVLLLCLALLAACLAALAEPAGVVKLSIANPPDKTRYVQGEPFDPTGMKVDGR